MTKRLSVTARDYLFEQWTHQLSVSKQIENPTLNYQFEGTKSILVCAGGTLVGYDTDARVRYDRGARAWRAHDVRTVAYGRANGESEQ